MIIRAFRWCPSTLAGSSETTQAPWRSSCRITRLLSLTTLTTIFYQVFLLYAAPGKQVCFLPTIVIKDCQKIDILLNHINTYFVNLSCNLKCVPNRKKSGLFKFLYCLSTVSKVYPSVKSLHWRYYFAGGWMKVLKKRRWIQKWYFCDKFNPCGLWKLIWGDTYAQSASFNRCNFLGAARTLAPNLSGTNP